MIPYLELTLNNDCAIAVFNLIYYAGRWNMPFNESDTKKRSFHKIDCDTIVDMMYQELRTRYYHTNKYKTVTMSLGGDNSLILILPKKGLTPKDFIATFDSSTIKRIINNSQYTDLKLFLPKFEINDQQLLLQPLEKMGIELFPSQFKEIRLWTRSRLIDMSMNQLSKFKIDEQGVEASVETKSITCILLAHYEEDEPQPIVIKFDRPFIFLLRNDKTKSLIMTGIYAGPEE
ncbi:MAG: serpin family protein [Muribaculaceae bacterium]|nr:serpin family protein [Muribaculaceae bacterium]